MQRRRGASQLCGRGRDSGERFLDTSTALRELGGVQDAQVPGGSGNPGLTLAALQVLDSRISLNTFTTTRTMRSVTSRFLNAYLVLERRGAGQSRTRFALCREAMHPDRAGNQG